MLFPTDVSNLRLVLHVVDSNNQDVTGIDFDDPDLQVSYLLESGIDFVTPTLVLGTIGTYLANSWVERGNGLYQWCPPTEALVANTTTLVRLTYDGQTQYDTMEPKLAPANDGSTTIVSLISSAGMVPGVIVGPTEPLVIGDDYLTSLGRNVRLDLLDADGNAAEVVFGNKSLADVDCSIQLLLHRSGKPTTTAVIVGTCTFHAAVGDVPPYLVVEFPKAETALAVPGGYDMQAEAKWGDGKTVTFAPYGQIEFVRDIQRRA